MSNPLRPHPPAKDELVPSSPSHSPHSSELEPREPKLVMDASPVAEPLPISILSGMPSSLPTPTSTTTEDAVTTSSAVLTPFKPTEFASKTSASLSPNPAPSASPSAPTPSNTSSSKPSVPKALAKKRVVKTNGGDLWRKAIQKSQRPMPFPDMTVPFNLTTPEVLDSICAFIHGDDLLRLFMTGDRLLQHRLKIAISSASFLRPFPDSSCNDSERKWPQMLKEFPSIRHLSLLCTQAEQKPSVGISSYPVVPLASLPRCMRTLKLECGMTNMDFSLLKEFTNLDLLHLGPRTNLSHHSPFSFGDLPPNLTFLYCSYPLNLPAAITSHPIDEPLPEEKRALVPAFEFLRTLDLPNDTILGERFVQLLHPDTEVLKLPSNCNFKPEWILNLPAGLKTLVLNFERLNAGDFLPGVPSSVETLEFRGLSLVGLNNDVFKRLPKTLRHLRLPSHSQLRLELFAGSWPLPNLLSLDIRGDNRGIILQDLPRTLQALRLNGSFGQDLLMLPPKLTYLYLPDVLATNDFIQVISTDLKTLKLPSASSLTSGCIWRLPKGLTNLTLGGAFTNQDIANLPRGLTRLCLKNASSINDVCAGDLPRGLTRFEVRDSNNFSFHCRPFLPSCLEVFRLAPDEQWRSKVNTLPIFDRQYRDYQRHVKAMKDKSLNLIDGRPSRS